MFPSLSVPSWVKKHLITYDRIEDIPPDVIERIRTNLNRLQSDNPVATIGIIAYNEEKTILRCLSSLSDQTCPFPIEIIVSNNNSKDRTQEVLDLVGARSVLETRQGVGFAREAILTKAKGKFMLNADADIIFPPSWADEFVRNLSKKGVAGVFSVDTYIPDGRRGRLGLAVFETLRDVSLALKCINRSELAVGGGSFGFLTERGREIGWKTNIRSGEDGAMAHALKKYGKILFLNNRKVRIWTTVRSLREESLGLLVLQRLKKEASRIHEYFSPHQGEYTDRPENLLPPQRFDAGE